MGPPLVQEGTRQPIADQCCVSGIRSGIRCLFDPWIRDPGWVKIRIRDEQPDHISETLKQFFGLKILFFKLILLHGTGFS